MAIVAAGISRNASILKGSLETGLPRTPVPTGDPQIEGGSSGKIRWILPDGGKQIRWQIGAGERTGPAMANAVAVSGRLPQELHPPFPLGERKGTF